MSTTLTRNGTPGSSGRIFLTGLMGSGKTTVGLHLAEILGCDYLDNDALLLSSHGASAQDLAVVLGAAALHAGEASNLRALIELPGPFVASVAASAGDRPADLTLLVRSGNVVYLRARPQTLAGRVGSGDGRPWLNDDPAPVLLRMFEQRDPAFLLGAGTVIDTDGADALSVAHRIARTVRSGLG